jgi:hypothetical protein
MGGSASVRWMVNPPTEAFARPKAWRIANPQQLNKLPHIRGTILTFVYYVIIHG